MNALAVMSAPNVWDPPRRLTQGPFPYSDCVYAAGRNAATIVVAAGGAAASHRLSAI
jgi:hypothetical protein